MSAFGSLFVLAAFLVEPAGSADNTVVKPLVIEGKVNASVKQDLEASLRAGLDRIELPVVDDVDEATSCVISGEVRESERDYEVVLRIEDPEDPERKIEVRQVCEICSFSAVGQMIEDEVAVLAARRGTLAVTEPVPETVEPAEPARSAEQLDDEKADRARLQRNLGWASVATGGAAIGASIPLFALHGNAVQRHCTGNNIDVNGLCRYQHTTRGGGVVLISAGAALVATGVALVVVSAKSKKRSREDRIRVTGLGVAGRF